MVRGLSAKRDWQRAFQLLPLLASLLAIVAVTLGAALHNDPWPVDVAGVFIVIGLVATLLTRGQPWRGALFIVGVATIVVGVLYG